MYTQALHRAHNDLERAGGGSDGSAPGGPAAPPLPLVQRISGSVGPSLPVWD